MDEFELDLEDTEEVEFDFDQIAEIEFYVLVLIRTFGRPVWRQLTPHNAPE